MRTSVRQSVGVITACMAVMLSMPCAPAVAAPGDSVIPGGRYVISIGRIHDVGEMYLARTKPVLRAGSTIGFELSGCEQDHSVAVVEVDLRGTYIHPDGRFRLRKVVKFYGGGVAEIWHVQGLFISSTFAHGTVWGTLPRPDAECVPTGRCTSKPATTAKATTTSTSYFARINGPAGERGTAALGRGTRPFRWAAWAGATEYSMLSGGADGEGVEVVEVVGQGCERRLT